MKRYLVVGTFSTYEDVSEKEPEWFIVKSKTLPTYQQIESEFIAHIQEIAEVGKSDIYIGDIWSNELSTVTVKEGKE